MYTWQVWEKARLLAQQMAPDMVRLVEERWGVFVAGTPMASAGYGDFLMPTLHIAP